VKEMTDIEVPVKIGSAGRAQIPQETREKLNIDEGDYLIIKIERVIKGEIKSKEAQS
jgi:AbrB family looped-hinge helix DNA binding protein